MEYEGGSHTKFKIEYHFVWVTKYRYHVLQGDIALRVRDVKFQKKMNQTPHVFSN